MYDTKLYLIMWLQFRRSGEYEIKVKLATLVQGDPKTPFSIATTLRCRIGRYFIPWIAPLYSWSVPYNAELNIFWVFGMTRPGIEPRSPGLLANTLLISQLPGREYEVPLHYHYSKSALTLSVNLIYQPLRSGRIWHKVSF